MHYTSVVVILELTTLWLLVVRSLKEHGVENFGVEDSEASHDDGHDQNSLCIGEPALWWVNRPTCTSLDSHYDTTTTKLQKSNKQNAASFTFCEWSKLVCEMRT